MFWTLCVSGSFFTPRSPSDRASMFEFSESFNSYFVSSIFFIFYPPYNKRNIFHDFKKNLFQNSSSLSLSLIKAWRLWVAFALKMATWTKTTFPWAPPPPSPPSPQGWSEDTFFFLKHYLSSSFFTEIWSFNPRIVGWCHFGVSWSRVSFELCPFTTRGQWLTGPSEGRSSQVNFYLPFVPIDSRSTGRPLVASILSDSWKPLFYRVTSHGTAPISKRLLLWFQGASASSLGPRGPRPGGRLRPHDPPHPFPPGPSQPRRGRPGPPRATSPPARPHGFSYLPPDPRGPPRAAAPEERRQCFRWSGSGGDAAAGPPQLKATAQRWAGETPSHTMTSCSGKKDNHLNLTPKHHFIKRTRPVRSLESLSQFGVFHELLFI